MAAESLPLVTTRSPLGKWDGPLRAAGVAAAWALGALPAILGWQKCTMATLFHRPCPGCGMTRAVHLLAEGHVRESLQMHPLTVPLVMVWLLFAGSTVWATWTTGTPVSVVKTRFGRVTLAAMVVVYVATFVLWTLRWFGLFGGPVPVD